MSDREKIKWASFTAIATLAGLLIVIINAHALFSELVFNGLVLTVMLVIVVVLAYAFLWERIARYVSGMMMRRARDKLARAYFSDFGRVVEKFILVAEFRSLSRGIPQVLDNLTKNASAVQGANIHWRIQNGGTLVQTPLDDFKRRLDNLLSSARSGYWKDVSQELLSNLAKEFEHYVKLHKALYVDFAVTMAREIGLDRVSQSVKRAYSEYKEDYNQFIASYTEFASKAHTAGLWLFDKSLQRASEL